MPTKLCKKCDGKGYKECHTFGICNACNDLEEHRKDCKTCDKKGWKTQIIEELCDTCDGEGKLTS